MKLEKKNIDGVTVHTPINNRNVRIVGSCAPYSIQVRSQFGWLYLDERCTCIEAATDKILENESSLGYISNDGLKDICRIYGFDKTGINEYQTERKTERGILRLKIRRSKNGFYTFIILHPNNIEEEINDIESGEVLTQIIDDTLSDYQISDFKYILSDIQHRKDVIVGASNSRKLEDNIVRVKSSNVWGYYLDIKNRKDKTGDLIVQFKGPHGGPGDVYMYFDVPVLLYRKWHTAPSKGHFFWVNIRNDFKYRKLTGDKRGKLENAVN